MERTKRQKYNNDATPAVSEERDSPTIRNLIQQLNQDLEEATCGTSDARQSRKSA